MQRRWPWGRQGGRAESRWSYRTLIRPAWLLSSRTTATTGADDSGLCQGHDRQRALNCQPDERQTAGGQQADKQPPALAPCLHASMAPPRALRAALHHGMMHTTARPPWSSMSLQYPRPPLHVSLWALACTRPQIAPLERHAGHHANQRPSRRPPSRPHRRPGGRAQPFTPSRLAQGFSAGGVCSSARPLPHGFDASSSTRRHTRWLASVGSATALARGHSPEWPRWT